MNPTVFTDLLQQSVDDGLLERPPHTVVIAMSLDESTVFFTDLGKRVFAAERTHPQWDFYTEAGNLLHCEHCERVVFYSYADDAYHHFDDPAQGCFLIGPEDAKW